jgi:hypothetical protein
MWLDPLSVQARFEENSNGLITFDRQASTTSYFFFFFVILLLFAYGIRVFTALVVSTFVFDFLACFLILLQG